MYRAALTAGGELGLDSEPGRGARFYFSARLHRDPATSESHLAAAR